MIVISETESPKKIWYIARRFRIPRELIGRLLSTMKRTYIDWSDQMHSRVVTGLEYSGKSLFLGSVSLRHLVSEPVAELNIRFMVAAPKFSEPLRAQFIDGSSSLVSALDKGCKRLGLYWDDPFHRAGYSNVLRYGFKFKGKPFSEAAIEMLAKLFEDVLLVDAGYLYWLRMTQETVLRGPEDRLVPYSEHVLKRLGINPCPLL